jgi:hypothetical protein
MNPAPAVGQWWHWTGPADYAFGPWDPACRLNPGDGVIIVHIWRSQSPDLQVDFIHLPSCRRGFFMWKDVEFRLEFCEMIAVGSLEYYRELYLAKSSMWHKAWLQSLFEPYPTPSLPLSPRRPDIAPTSKPQTCPRCGIDLFNMVHRVWGCHEDSSKWPVNQK